jgi:putative aldouronate transport system permease protein
VKRSSAGDIVFDICNGIFMVFVIFITLYPFYYVLCASFMDSKQLVLNTGFIFFPKKPTIGAYKMTFSYPLVKYGYKNTLIILIASLPINLIMTLLCANLMAAKNVMLKKALVSFVLVTMFFSGGLIPTYLNMRSLGLYNSLWALILPGSLNVYNSIITKTAIEKIPDSLTEAAYIDGANDFYILFKITAVLIKPTLAVIVLYYAVAHWNSWFPAMIYIKDNKKLPIQAVLRAVLIENQMILNPNMGDSGEINHFAETIKYSLIIVGTLPILASYPFLQKYFIKGIMIGAIKG